MCVRVCVRASFVCAFVCVHARISFDVGNKVYVMSTREGGPIH